MSKLLNSVLDKISENNNDYRKELRNLDASIDERTTNYISEIVTGSNYTLDFSSTISSAKDKLVSPICSEVESYVIKDLRGVESVNEQFFEKINDKIESSNLDTEEDKENFARSLDTLLNDKYLEIVKIKRTPFVNDDNNNEVIESIVSTFVSELTDEVQAVASDATISYKNDIYGLISNSLQKISDLYQDNFVSEISSALSSAIDYKEVDEVVAAEPTIEDHQESESSEDVPLVNTLDMEQLTTPALEELVPSVESEEEAIKQAEEDVVNVNKPLVLIDEDRLPKLKEFVPPVLPSVRKKEEGKTEVVSESYDIDKILEIAKNPVSSENKDAYKDISPISIEEDKYTSSVDEKQVVEEMIKRLVARLNEINKREATCDEEEEQIKEDETFVNDLIESAAKKKEELDEFERELDEKEKEINTKQAELDEKINNIMPFANAVLESEKES